MRIDAHIHLDGQNRFNEGILDVADHYKVKKLCLSALGMRWPREPSHEVCVEANKATLGIMRRFPDRIIGFCYVNPMHGQLAVDELVRCINELGFGGLKLWVAVHADDPRVFPVVEKAIDLRLTVLQHAWFNMLGPGCPGESTPTHVANLGRRYPEAKILMAHMGGDWERGIKAIKHVPNVRTDVCGTDNYTGIVEMCVRELGVERVIFGTDCPGRSMASQIGKVLGADIPDADKERILGENMEKLLDRT